MHHKNILNMHPETNNKEKKYVHTTLSNLQAAAWLSRSKNKP